MEKFKKICKTKLFIGFICFIIGGVLFSNNDSKEELDKYNAQLLSQKQTIEQKDDEISKLNTSLSETNEKAKEYLSLTTNEKSTIDEKIEEVKQNTIDEENRIKAEAEERKRQEEEQLRVQQAQQEELERQKQSQETAQAQQPVNNTVESNDTQEQLVWITETGKKYHSKPNCGNSKTSTQVSLSEAQSRGLDACKNCH